MGSKMQTTLAIQGARQRVFPGAGYQLNVLALIALTQGYVVLDVLEENDLLILSRLTKRNDLNIIR